MKTARVAIPVILLLALNAPSGEDRQNSASQVMSLRLELFVRDLQKSAEFYTRVLAFERLPGQDDYAPVRAGSVQIGLGRAADLSPQHFFNPELRSGRRGLGAEIVLEVDDVRACFEEVKAAGYNRILSPPRQQLWGLTDFRLADPDGYYLRVTSR